MAVAWLVKDRWRLKGLPSMKPKFWPLQKDPSDWHYMDWEIHSPINALAVGPIWKALPAHYRAMQVDSRILFLKALGN